MESHHVLLALPGVGLTRLHGLHQAVSVVSKVELIGIWRDIHIVVQAAVVQRAHLIHARVEVDVVSCTESTVWRVQVLTLRTWSYKRIELHLTWARDDHIFFHRLFLSVIVVMMVMVMHMAKIRVDKAVSLNLCCRLKMEMLR